jgi:hypothetical protein
MAAFADLFERYPNKSFYFFCDDDSFVVPANLLHFAGTLNSEKLAVYGKFYYGAWFADPFYDGTTPAFIHGGAGQLYTGALMRAVGPHLRKCGRVFDIPAMGSDQRIAICIARTVTKDTPQKHRGGFNSCSPMTDRNMIAVSRQVTFHRIFRDEFDVMFGAVVTMIDSERYIDWSPIAFRPVNFAIGGTERAYWSAFGYGICAGITDYNCMQTNEGIVRSDRPWANFSQTFPNGFVVYLRCNQQLSEGELAFFGEPPPPDFGVILEVNCSEPKRFPNAGKARVKRVTIEEEPMI